VRGAADRRSVPMLGTTEKSCNWARSSRELVFLMRRVLKGASALLANSHNTAHELTSLNVPPEKISRYPPGCGRECLPAITAHTPRFVSAMQLSTRC
jgi:hypothetical protein